MATDTDLYCEKPKLQNLHLHWGKCGKSSS